MVLSAYESGTMGDRWEKVVTLESASTGISGSQKSSSSLRELGQAGGKQELGTVTKHLKRLHKHHDPYKLKAGDPGLKEQHNEPGASVLKTHDPNLTPS